MKKQTRSNNIGGANSFKALWAAVIRYAVIDFLDPVTDDDLREAKNRERTGLMKRLRNKRNAERFFSGGGNFVVACEALDLDEDAARKRIYELRDRGDVRAIWTKLKASMKGVDADLMMVE